MTSAQGTGRRKVESRLLKYRCSCAVDSMTYSTVRRFSHVHFKQQQHPHKDAHDPKHENPWQKLWTSNHAEHWKVQVQAFDETSDPVPRGRPCGVQLG